MRPKKLVSAHAAGDNGEAVHSDDAILWGCHVLCKPASHYWPIRPLSSHTVRVALEPSTRANGCLGVIPRWHRAQQLHDHLHEDRNDFEVGHRRRTLLCLDRVSDSLRPCDLWEDSIAKKLSQDLTQRYFKALNIPSRSDIMALTDRLLSLDDRMIGIQATLDRIAGGPAHKPALPAPARTRRPPEPPEPLVDVVATPARKCAPKPARKARA